MRTTNHPPGQRVVLAARASAAAPSGSAAGMTGTLSAITRAGVRG